MVVGDYLAQTPLVNGDAKSSVDHGRQLGGMPAGEIADLVAAA